MSDVVATAKVVLRGDTTQLKGDLDRQIKPVADQAGKTASDSFSRSFSSGVKALVSGVVLTQLAQFGKASIKAAGEAQRAQLELNSAFERFPQLAGANTAAIDELANATQRKTRFDDESVRSAAAVLAQFKLTEPQIRTLIPLLSDYAAKTGTDLPAGATALGRALLGQGRALKAVGIDFKDTGTTAGNFAQLVDGLAKSVGGFAEKEGKTVEGRLKILDNRFGEVSERLGTSLLPLFERLADVAVVAADVLDRIPGPLLTIAVGALGASVALYGIANAIKAVTGAAALLPIAKVAAGISSLIVPSAALALGTTEVAAGATAAGAGLLSVLGPVALVVAAAGVAGFAIQKLVGQGSLGGFVEKAAESAAKAPALASSIANIGEAFAEATDPLTAFKNALEATLGIQLGVEEASARFQSAIAAVGKSLSEGATSTDLNTEAGRKLADQLRAVVDAAGAEVEAFAKAGIISEGSAGQVEGLRQRLDALALKFPELAPVIAGYAKKLDDIPEEVKTDLTVNPAPGLAGIDRFKAAINSIPRSAQVLLGISGIGGLTKAQHGGIHGGMVTVGEAGPETVFLPPGSHVRPSTVTNNFTATINTRADQAPSLVALLESRYGWGR